MVYLFNITIKNILSNYIPHEKITCDDRNSPWINNTNKQLIQEINNTYRIYILRNKNPQMFEKVKYLQKQLKPLTESNKEIYCLCVSKKPENPTTSAKTYWLILESVLNNKKIPCVPLLFHHNKYVTNFKKKAELFNCFFAIQCSIIDNCREIPSNIWKKTDNSMNFICPSRSTVSNCHNIKRVKFLITVSYKISESNSSFYVIEGITGKV